MSQMLEESYLEKNFESYKSALPNLNAAQLAQHALLRDGEIIEFFDTARDAFRAGRQLYPDHHFSVQEATDVYPSSLTRYHAIHH